MYFDVVVMLGLQNKEILQWAEGGVSTVTKKEQLMK